MEEKTVKLSSIFEEYGRSYCTIINPDADFLHASDIGVSYRDASINCERFHKWKEDELAQILSDIPKLSAKGIKCIDDIPHRIINFI